MQMMDALLEFLGETMQLLIPGQIAPLHAANITLRNFAELLYDITAGERERHATVADDDRRQLSLLIPATATALVRQTTLSWQHALQSM